MRLGKSRLTRRWRQVFPLCYVALASLLAAATATVAVAQAAGQLLPAFPEAEGFGVFTVGGRGGDVYVVTTLEDYSPEESPVEGSLRADVESQGARTIVFRVAGYV